MLKRYSIFFYGLVCYAISLATFLYAVGFVGNLWGPRSIDGAPDSDLATALLVDLGLLLVFALQHSVMARPVFKRWWTSLIPGPAERSTYALASSLALIALFAYWRPLGGNVWSVHGLAAVLLYALCGSGWLLVLVSTFLIDHFDLFGLRQAWRFLAGKPCGPVNFVTPGPYRLVRHPLYVGFLLAFWATPQMTASHLLFSLGTTAYILIGVRFEERDLVSSLGGAYHEYRERVPMLIPFAKRRSPAGIAAAGRQA